jgi:hypothetical protein
MKTNEQLAKKKGIRRYRIPWWLRNALRQIENVLIRKVLGQPAIPGGLIWFEQKFAEWAHGQVTDKQFLVIVEEYVEQLQEAGEALVGDGHLYHAVAEGLHCKGGEIEWTEIENTERPIISSKNNQG